MKFPIRNKLIVLILILVLPVFILSIHHYFKMVEDGKQNIFEYNYRLAGTLAGQISAMIERSHAALQAFGMHPAVVNRNSSECDRIAASLLPSFPEHLNILAADMHGNNYCSAVYSPDVRKLNYQDREWFQKASTGVPVVGNLHISKLFKKPSVMIARPVIKNKRQVGVIGMPLDLSKACAALARQQRIPSEASGIVVDSSGNVIFCICEQKEASGAECAIKQLPFPSSTTRIEYTWEDGENRIFSSAPVPGTGWKVFVGMPAEKAYHSATAAARNYIIIICSTTLVSILLAFALSDRIAKSVSELITGMQGIEEGDFAARLPETGHDELTMAAASFNRMADRRKNAEERLKQSESFLSSVLEGIGEGVVVIDRDFRIISANQGYCNQAKRPCSDIIGKHCYEISHRQTEPCNEEDGGCDCSVKKCFETGEHHRAVHKHYDKDGKIAYIETRAYPLRDASGRITAAIETLTDVTEKQALEAQLLQAQKMEAVGVLAGGVAHDFNNILTAIIGYGNLLKLKLGQNDSALVFADQILSAANRAAHLTKSLLAFSRKQIIDPRPIRINEIILRIEKMLHRIIGEDIELRIKLSSKDAAVFADAHQIEQVLMNLCTNARDAMPDGGTLTFETDVFEPNEGSLREHPELKQGMYVKLTVIDTGVGMSKETLEKIFDPFFTTKETGKGTGLGLSIVYGIVRQHNGFIDVKSDPGKGTIFTIYLPVVEHEAESVRAAASSPTIHGTERILIAEDDEYVRSFTEHILREHGYQVVTAFDGVDALEKFEKMGGNVDMMILDVLMPRKNGKAVLDEVRKKNSAMKVLFMSGYTSDIIQRKGVMNKDIDLLAKPFSPETLLTKVREILDRVSH